MGVGHLLAVDNLGVRFHGKEGVVQAVDGVSLHLDPGETLALVGESGSGKSVTALALMGLLARAGGGRISAGAIHWRRRDGALVDLCRESPAALRRLRGNELSMIFQEPMTSLNPLFPVGEQISEAIRLHQGRDRRSALQRAGELLEQVRMPEPGRRLKQYPHELSGGMRQRVMIAMALSCRPSLLIADEPTTALDVTIQAQILELIRALQAEIGMAVLFITHDMGVVAEVADRVAVMHRGRIVETQPVEALFQAPWEAYTRRLLAAVPRLGGMAGEDRPQRFVGVDSETAPVGTHRPRPAGTGPVLEVSGLCKSFPLGVRWWRRGGACLHAVWEVSFSLAPGETLALVGESGCGKSTTGRAIMKLLEPNAGSIRVLGEEISGYSHRRMRPVYRHIQMVFQDPFAALNPRMRAAELVAEPLRLHGVGNRAERRARATELLNRVGLDAGFLRRYPHEFSGGQRQRLCIARALSLNPRVIIADEAVSALDVSIQAQVLNLMLDLQAELGLSYLFISHDMAVVERISHRVAVMQAGRIVEIGPRQAVFGNPRHPYTRKLLSAVPVPDPARRPPRRLLESSEAGALPHGREPLPVALVEVDRDHFVAPEAA